ncbi:hypothetical protein HPP92_017341 [Vanilla planifolia]|uniref:Uncharacterized protein n=1 Tax=Vanilla planifolia TaxID=51239 RepID=A0A835QGW6_VANPL|nr:hypothetical protein HPP92_017341 [Vanilla planifolia]
MDDLPKPLRLQSRRSQPLLPNLKSYFQRFATFLPPLNFSDFFDSDLADALLSYQRNLGLNPTGLLDPSTLSLLSSPRCGMPDTSPNSTAVASADDHGRHLYSYFPGTPTWPPYKRVLTYALTPVSSVNIDIETLRPVFARAFARWAAASTLNFTEVTPDSEDIDLTVGFCNGDHGDGAVRWSFGNAGARILAY